MDDAILIAAYLSQEKAKKQRSMVDQAKMMLYHARLLKMRMYLKPRHFLHASALFKSVLEAPWYVMYRVGSDSDFITAISLTRSSFENLLSSFKRYYTFNSGPSKRGRPPRVKDHHCVLSLLLHTYCSPADNKTWSEMFGISPATLSRTLVKAEIALLATLNSMREARIEWPSLDDQVRMALAVEAKEPIVKGRWGFIDGKNYRVQEPSNCDIQNGMYNGWLHSVFVTGTVCFSADGLIIWAKLNFFGSWNDSEMSREFREKLADDIKNVPGHGVLSDSAFPVSSDMFGRIMTPLKDGDVEKAHPNARPALIRLACAITSMRQSAEWGMGAVSKVYRNLNGKLSFDKERRGRLLRVLHKLHNYRVRTTGISQIKNYFNA
jgi:DDE superfamily endonuclease